MHYLINFLQSSTITSTTNSDVSVNISSQSRAINSDAGPSLELSMKDKNTSDSQSSIIPSGENALGISKKYIIIILHI